MRIFRLFKRDLAREIEDWVDEGLIDTAQADSILARYGISRTDTGAGSSFGYYVLTSLAALFVGLALILIVSHNWDDIPRMTRMLGLIGLTLVVNLIGFRLLLMSRRSAAVIWLFFGSISYGMSIMLIAQIYHLGAHYPDGIYWWALGVLPLIPITRSRLIALLVLVLSTLWMFTEAKEQFFPTSYPLFALVSLWLVWFHKRSALLFLGALAGIATWLNLLLAWAAGNWWDYDPFTDQVMITLALGLLLAGFAWWMMRQDNHDQRDYGQLLHLYLLRGAIISLLLLSYDDPWRGMIREEYLLGVFTPLMMAVATLVGFALARPSGINSGGPLLANGVFFTLAALCVQQGWLNDDLLAIATNLMLVVTGIWLIRRGIDDAVTHFFYTGVGVLLVTALFRYFDLIGDYIGGAIMFMIAAAILYGSARYWRSRVQKGGRHV
ncbi:DUF2157 domain-containing protein [Marinobacterium litorale]|uniref:DUF2157 domain-containing protein n=1 Tax=Marinobacterium litorale TaxID=404770 RepID=UPI000429A74F|nr:DUF2157 domain-containing protein [Marinobacterium litorale]